MTRKVIGVTDTGIVVNVTNRHHAGIPEFAGRHLWAVFAMWRVANPARDSVNLDQENLLTLEGPACFYCEQAYSPTLGAICPGEGEDSDD